MTPEHLYAALNKKVGFEVVTHKIADNQIRLVGRSPSQTTGTWLRVIQNLLVYGDSAPWSVDVSKQYFMRGQKLMYGWRLIFQGEGVSQYLQHIIQVVNSTPEVQQQLMEVPLHTGRDRNSLRNGKGAQSVIGARVGPLALMGG